MSLPCWKHCVHAFLTWSLSPEAFLRLLELTPHHHSRPGLTETLLLYNPRGPPCRCSVSLEITPCLRYKFLPSEYTLVKSMAFKYSEKKIYCPGNIYQVPPPPCVCVCVGHTARQRGICMCVLVHVEAKENLTCNASGAAPGSHWSGAR